MATDITEKFVEENRRTNGAKYSNTSFRVEDASQMDYPSSSFDLIFGFWIVQYLSDADLPRYVSNCLK